MASSSARSASVQRQLQVPLAEPFRHQRHLACQRAAIVGRQRARRLAALRPECAAAPASASSYSASASAPAAQPRQVRDSNPRSSSSTKPRALYRWPRLAARAPRSARAMPSTCRYGRDVLLVGRRVHDDARRAVGAPGAEIAPEAGIGRGRRDAAPAAKLQPSDLRSQCCSLECPFRRASSWPCSHYNESPHDSSPHLRALLARHSAARCRWRRGPPTPRASSRGRAHRRARCRRAAAGRRAPASPPGTPHNPRRCLACHGSAALKSSHARADITYAAPTAHHQRRRQDRTLRPRRRASGRSRNSGRQGSIYDRNNNSLSASGAGALSRSDGAAAGRYRALQRSRRAEFNHGAVPAAAAARPRQRRADLDDTRQGHHAAPRDLQQLSAQRADWQIRAREIALDTAAGRGIGHGATVDFEGVPILYLPWISFPLSSARQSGVLFPELRQLQPQRRIPRRAVVLEHRAEPGRHLYPDLLFEPRPRPGRANTGC